VIAIAAMLSDSDTVEDIAYWARKKGAWLRRLLVLKNGIASEDSFLRIFRVLDPKQFEAVFRRWVAGVVGALGGTIAVDGKTVRGSGNGGETALHMASAFATELGVVLGQDKVAGKRNEITAIPVLLDALYISGHRQSHARIGWIHLLLIPLGKLRYSLITPGRIGIILQSFDCDIFSSNTQKLPF
jgi:hypothetical protein